MFPSSSQHHLRHSGNSVGSVSACSDLRELNEAKVQGILNYLEDVHQPPTTHNQQSNQFPLGASAVSSVGEVAPSSRTAAVTGHALTSSGPTDLGQFLLSAERQRQEPSREAQLTGNSGELVYADPTSLGHLQGQQPHSFPQQHHQASNFTTVSALTATNTQLGGLSQADSNVPSVYNSVKGKLQALKVEADTNAKENERLKQELATQKMTAAIESKKVLQAQEAEADAKRLVLEKTIQNHLLQLKQLVTDKEHLTNRVKELGRQNEEMKNSRESEVHKVEMKHAKVLNEAQTKMQAIEKAKREQWAAKETKKIKEMIHKQMEPEVAAMIGRHKAEMRRLEETHQEQLKGKQATLEVKEKEVQNLRERHAQELESSLARERELFRQRLSEESDRTQRSVDFERRASQEKVDSLGKEIDSLRAEIKSYQSKLLEAQMKERELEQSVQKRILAEVESIRQAKENEILSLKSQLMEQRQGWQRDYDKDQAAYLSQKEAEIMKRCENQRDLEIQKVMSEFEKELVKETTEHKALEKKHRETQSTLTREVDRLNHEVVLMTEQREKSVDLLKEKHTESEQLKDEIQKLRQEVRTTANSHEVDFNRRLKEFTQQWEFKLNSSDRKHAIEIEDLKGQLARKDSEILQVRNDADTALRSLEQQQHLELSAINDRVLVVVSQKDQQLKVVSDENNRLKNEVAGFRAEMGSLMKD